MEYRYIVVLCEGQSEESFMKKGIDRAMIAEVSGIEIIIYWSPYLHSR